MKVFIVMSGTQNEYSIIENVYFFKDDAKSRCEELASLHIFDFEDHSTPDHIIWRCRDHFIHAIEREVEVWRNNVRN